MIKACKPFNSPAAALSFVFFCARILTLWLRNSWPIAHLAANNRFSRWFVLLQKRVSIWIRENEYIFKATAICTSFGAICCKMECVLVLNARRFDAKCKAF